MNAHDPKRGGPPPGASQPLPPGRLLGPGGEIARLPDPPSPLDDASPFDPGFPRLRDMILDKMGDALARLAGDVPIVNWDLTSMFVPVGGEAQPVPVAVVISRGIDLSGPARELSGWKQLTGWSPTQAQVDDRLAELVKALRNARANLARQANGGKR